jgi:branched-chain amino acid aminotransferase
MGDGTSGHYAALLKNWLLEIKYGLVEHPWGVICEE